MIEISSFLEFGFLSYLVIRTLIAGTILLIVSRIFFPKGGIIAPFIIIIISIIGTIIIEEEYIIPLLENDSETIVDTLKNEVFGYVLSFAAPIIIWIFALMIFMRMGLFSAIGVSILIKAIDYAIIKYEIFIFVAEYI